MKITPSFLLAFWIYREARVLFGTWSAGPNALNSSRRWVLPWAGRSPQRPQAWESYSPFRRRLAISYQVGRLRAGDPLEGRWVNVRRLRYTQLRGSWSCRRAELRPQVWHLEPWGHPVPLTQWRVGLPMVERQHFDVQGHYEGELQFWILDLAVHIGGRCRSSQAYDVPGPF